MEDNEYWKKLRSTIISQNSVKIEFNCFQTNPKYFIDILSPNRLPLITTKSIQIAYAYAKIFVKKLDPSNNILSQNLDLNMSAIIGNYFVLINGPSAGCTFVTVFISFALQKPVNRNLGAKYLVFVSSCFVKLRELSFAQFVYFLGKVCLIFNFWMIKFTIMFCLTSRWEKLALLNWYTFRGKCVYFSIFEW